MMDINFYQFSDINILHRNKFLNIVEYRSSKHNRG